MARLIGIMGSLFALVCVATVLALTLGLGYAWTMGKLDREKVFRILAVVHDVDLGGAKKSAEDSPKREPSAGQPSVEDIDQARALKSRDLELKTQSVEQGLEQLRFLRDQLTADKQRYAQLKQTFETRMNELQDTSRSTGYANVRQVWENMKPKQAKDQILKMIEAEELEDVVVILSDMPADKRGKIISQFTAEPEVEVLDQILRMIRQGGAERALIDATREQPRTN